MVAIENVAFANLHSLTHSSTHQRLIYTLVDIRHHHVYHFRNACILAYDVLIAHPVVSLKILVRMCYNSGGKVVAQASERSSSEYNGNQYEWCCDDDHRHYYY